MSVFNSTPPKQDKEEFVYPSNHLKFFKELLDVTGLIGDEYIPIIKSLWYSLLSTKIATKSLAEGKIRIDGRIHLLIFLKSGHGKGEIKRTLKQVLKGIDKSLIEPTSFHPEQFVGKIKQEKDKDGGTTYKEILGHLSKDYVIIDEGKNLLTSNDNHYTESRRYLRQALDQYPDNEITKKSVDIEYQHALKFIPCSCVSIFLQPNPISEEIVLDGDFRRFIVPYVMTGDYDKSDRYSQRLRTKSTNEESLINFTEFLDSLNVEEEFNLTPKAIDALDELSNLIIGKGNVKSTKINNYIDMVGYTIQNTLFKFSAIQALQENSHLIKEKHVEFAFLDYAEILEHTYEFLEKKILGSMDYGDKWSGAIKKDQKILKWLNDKGAVSNDKSNITIDDFKKNIMEIFNINERQARRYKAKYEENGWIESKKGQHDSKVWLAFKPDTTTPSQARRVRVDTTFREKCQEIIVKHDLK